MEQPYLKPENDKKVNEQMEIFEKIPEEIINSITVKSDNLLDKDEHKFLLIEDEKEQKYFITVSSKTRIDHPNIFTLSKKLYNKDSLRIIQGGYISYNIEENKLRVEKNPDHLIKTTSSNKNIIREILKYKFPNVDIKISSFSDKW